MRNPKTIEELGPRQLWNLRKDIRINSLYLSDYENRYNLDTKETYDFFMGYLDYLEEEIKDTYSITNIDNYWDMFDEFDTPKNLLRWWFCWVG